MDILLQVPSEATSELETFAIDVALFLVTTGIVYITGRFVLVNTVREMFVRSELDETVTNPAVRAMHVVVAVFSVLVGIAVSGVASILTATAAVSAAIAIAIGFAAQDVLGNLVAGVFLVGDPKFRIGDWIRWQDREGVIEDITFRVTRVRTFDNELVTVPNMALATNPVTNPVAKRRLRLVEDFGVGYEDDIDVAKRIVLDVLVESNDVLEHPEPTVLVKDLADSSVVLRARFWIPDPSRTDFINVQSRVRQEVKERFDDADVEMPYPYRTLTGGVDVNERTSPGETVE